MLHTHSQSGNASKRRAVLSQRKSPAKEWNEIYPGSESMSPEDFDAQGVAQYWSRRPRRLRQSPTILLRKATILTLYSSNTVEKELKGLHAIRQGQHAPPIHNLLRLAKATGLAPNESQTELLIRITAFNIEARYPDPKRDFRRSCTAEYAAEQLATIREVMAWLKSQRMC
jgi:hypothetical protein